MLNVAQSQEDHLARRRVWAGLAWILAMLILVTAWLPGRQHDWSRAAILVLLLALASEWLVLRRIYHHQSAGHQSRHVVKVIMSVLLVISAIILAVSSTRF
jgi:phosphatidylserine synthase